MTNKQIKHKEKIKDYESHIDWANKRIEELEGVLEAWHTVFGTTQLTHAQCNYEVALKDYEIAKKRIAELEQKPNRYFTKEEQEKFSAFKRNKFKSIKLEQKPRMTVGDIERVLDGYETIANKDILYRKGIAQAIVTKFGRKE